MEPVRVLDLFAGAAGFTYGLHTASPRFETVAFSEVDKFCNALLEKRYPGIPNLGSINHYEEWDYEALGRIDLVTFGSPCQGLSVAGQGKGLADKRSKLFYEAIEVIRRVKPRFALWENVVGALSSNKRRDFGCALDALADAGALDIAWRVLDAQNFGVPQRRRRVFVAADFRGESAGEILFEPEGREGPPAPRRGKEQVVTALTSNGVGTCGAYDNQAQGEHLLPVAFGHNNGSDSIAVVGATTKNRLDFKTQAFSVDVVPLPLVGARQDRAKNKRDGIGVGKPGDPMFTLQATKQHGVLCPVKIDPIAFHLTQDPIVGRVVPCLSAGNKQGAATAGVLTETGGRAPGIYGVGVRRLLPIECERLQGFPDNWTDVESGGKSTADAPRYRAMGNAVCTKVITWIGKRIARQFN